MHSSILEEYKREIEEMSDEDFLDLYYRSSGINRYRSKRYFRLKNVTSMNTQIIDLEESILELQEELEKLKQERHSLISEIKTSIAR